MHDPALFNVSAWYGRPPNHWRPTRFKHLFCEKRATSTPAFPPGAISFGAVVQKEMLNEDTLDSYQDVCAGDFLVNPINLNYDLKSLRTALSDINVRVSPAYIVLRHREGNNPRYLRWLLHQFDVAHMKTLGAGVRQTITYPMMGECQVFVPPSTEQERIANFLDEQTARIDALIAQKERLDGRLQEYRSSLISAAVTGQIGAEGVNDAGEAVCGADEGGVGMSTLTPFNSALPTKPLKYLAALRGEKVEGVPADGLYIGLEQIESGTGRLSDVELQQQPEGSANVFEPSDVLFGKLRPYLAKGWTADRTGYCTTEALVLQPLSAVPRFIRYCVLASEFIEAVNGSTYGSKMPRADWSFVGSVQIPCPNMADQERIANFLDEQTTRIDALRHHVHTHISRLREYRSSLISAAVTGQLDLSTFKAAA